MFGWWSYSKLCCEWKILKNNIFENIWVQPAAGDAGGSLGAALGYWHQELAKERKISNSAME